MHSAFPKIMKSKSTNSKTQRGYKIVRTLYTQKAFETLQALLHIISNQISYQNHRTAHHN